MGKVLFFIFMFIWLRGSLPRLRYDQFMAFGWKVLIPVSIVWIVAVAAIRVVDLRGGFDRDLADRRRGRARPSWSSCCCSSRSKDQEPERGRGRAVRRLRRRLPRAAHAGRRCRDTDDRMRGQR